MDGEGEEPVDNKEVLVLGAIGIAAALILYYAMQQTDIPIPKNQSEFQVMGLGASEESKYGAGTVLDLRPEIHFWNPGDYGEDIQPVVTPHRYPAVPGGNVTAVMHHGLSVLCNQTPNGNTWFIAPPEVATL